MDKTVIAIYLRLSNEDKNKGKFCGNHQTA